MDPKILAEGKRVLEVEAQALSAASEQLGPSYVQTVEALYQALKAGGKIVVSGVGKSGNVARKVSATLTSLGSTAVFLHPTEAVHGDLGILQPKDVLLLFSHSGASQEILLMLPAAKELCSGIYAVLGNPSGPISAHAQAVIAAPVSSEACPDNLAPTTSSTVAMAIGDAIALSLKMLAGFGPDHFARFHPGGSLGKRLLTRVQDLMHKEGSFGVLGPDAKIDEVVIALTQFRHSGICITEGKTSQGKNRLIGVITEGDIRRALTKKDGFFQLKASDLMTRKFSFVHPETKAQDALILMEQRQGQLSFLPVIDEQEGAVGVIRIHDLVLAGLH